MTRSGVGLPAVGNPFAGQEEDARATARRLVPTEVDSAGLNRLARLAATLTGSPSAQVSLISDVEHVAAGYGLEPGAIGRQLPREEALCAVVAGGTAALAIEDAGRDERVNRMPQVAGGAVGAYLGVPLVADGAHRIGALCVFSPTPRSWSPSEVELLQQLAESVVAELQLSALSAEYDANRLVWQLAVDAAGVGAFDWNVATGELRWDDRLLDLFGYDRESFTPDIDAFNARVHPDDLPRVSAALEHAVAGCGDYVSEYRIVLPDRGVRWIAARGRALRGDSGATERVIGAAYDTTEVHEGEARVGRILEAMSTAFYSLDRDWRFTYVNAEAEQLLGQPREALLGGNLWELFPAAVGSDFERHYRRAVERDEVVTFEAYYPAPLDGWYELRAYPMPEGLSVYFLEVTARRAAQEQLQRNASRSDLLATISGELTGTLDAEEAVGKLTRALVPQLAQWGTVTLIEGPPGSDWRRRVRDLGSWHADPEMLPVLERYNEVKVDAAYDSELVQQVLSEDTETIVVGQTRELVEQVLRPGEARDLALKLDPGPAISIPLRGRGRLLGMLSLNRTSEQPAFDDYDVDLLEEVAARAGLVLDNARLFAQQRDLAEGLQRSMLTEPSGSDRLDVAVRYEPAAEAAQVGGDWYDSFLVRDGVTMVVIGDVVGHDTAAAAAMGQVRGLLRAIAVHTGEGPATVLQGVDRAMRRLRVDVTATVVAASLERLPEGPDGGVVKRLRWTNAGHPDPILVTPEGEVVALSGAGADLLLGLDPDEERAECAIGLEPGATVLLYTDGLVERRGQHLDEGLANLRQVLRTLDVPRLGLEELCDELLLRMRPGRREDDVALVAVRVR